VDDPESNDRGAGEPSEPVWHELPKALRRLVMFGRDPFLSMQANNLGLIDRWLIEIEAQVRDRLHAEERTPIDDAMFLNAQTQMWIFAAYELLRNWRQRAKDTFKLVTNRGLQLKIDSLERDLGYQHFNRQVRAAQLREVMNEPGLATKLEPDLRRTHILFSRLEALRVSMAKHEVIGKPKLIALAPGYARIDDTTGSLRYEISVGRNILDVVSRRDIADSIRAIDHDGEPPTTGELAEFDTFMKGPPVDDEHGH
jgi:hypothetical protein